MKDRLIELLQKGEKDFFETGANAITTKQGYLADYLLANGVIVPPVEAGQTVWVISQWYKYTKPEIESRKVLSVQIYKNGDIQYHYKDGCFWQGHFGKTVFLTKEEAEKAPVTDTNVGSKKERENND